MNKRVKRIHSTENDGGCTLTTIPGEHNTELSGLFVSVHRVVTRYEIRVNLPVAIFSLSLRCILHLHLFRR